MLGLGIQKKYREPHGHEYIVVFYSCTLKIILSPAWYTTLLCWEAGVEFIPEIYDINKFLQLWSTCMKREQTT